MFRNSGIKISVKDIDDSLHYPIPHNIGGTSVLKEDMMIDFSLSCAPYMHYLHPSGTPMLKQLIPLKTVDN